MKKFISYALILTVVLSMCLVPSFATESVVLEDGTILNFEVAPIVMTRSSFIGNNGHSGVLTFTSSATERYYCKTGCGNYLKMEMENTGDTDFTLEIIIDGETIHSRTVAAGTAYITTASNSSDLTLSIEVNLTSSGGACECTYSFDQYYN